MTTITKPLGRKSYGSIGHLPGSRMEVNHQKYGTGKTVGKDFGIHPGMAKIATEKTRDKHDRIIVQEKLDGSNVSIARVGGQIIPLSRSGYPASSSQYEQHRLFWRWVMQDVTRWDWIPDNHRVCGEWLALAHGTIYKLPHEPFVAFDVMTEDRRLLIDDAMELCRDRVVWAHTISDGPPMSVASALSALGEFGFHGAQEPVEGAVWRCERQGKVDFLCKYVRPDKKDGKYLHEMEDSIVTEPVWNWKP